MLVIKPDRFLKTLEIYFMTFETLPEIGVILRPRSIWHAVSNYRDGGINKAVRRKKQGLK